MANGSHCEVCPLNGQRKVGVDGPRDAKIILVGEAPGREEEEYNSQYQQYGKPFVGRSGWSLKVKLLAPVQLADIETQEVGWPKVKKLNAFVMNVLMCRPPNNKITSPEGRKAVACCSNSAKTLLKELLAQSKDGLEPVVVPLGGTALALMTGKDTIGSYRGRVLQLQPNALDCMPEADILKIALRGQKPPPEMVIPLDFIARLVKMQGKRLSLSEEEVVALRWKEALRLAKTYLKVLESHIKSLSKVKVKRSKPSSSASESPAPAKARGRKSKQVVPPDTQLSE